MILLLILLLILIPCGVFLYFKHWKMSLSFFLFFSGLVLMIVSNSMYYLHRGMYTYSWFNTNHMFTRWILNMHFSFSTIKYVSLAGQICTLYSLPLMCFSTIKKGQYHILFILLSVIYFVINLPDVAYFLALAPHTHNSHSLLSNDNLYRFLVVVKFSIVTFFFLYPYLLGIITYLSKKFLIVRRNIMVLMGIVLLMESLLLILAITGQIDSFFHLSLDIFYIENASTEGISDHLLLFILFVFLSSFLVVAAKSKLFETHTGNISEKLFGKTKNLDFIMRMILHSYKNMFLSVKQLSSFALSSNEPHSPQIDEILNSINTLSGNALYQISHQINMLVSPDMVYKKVDLKSIVNQVTSKTEVPENVVIKTNYPPSGVSLYTDELYLSEILNNLINNSLDAIKSKANGKIEVTIDSEDSWVMLEVADNGCGIQPKLIRHIFKPLFSSKHSKTNWGIGLYYVSNIVKAHKGHIFINSKIDEYTKFIIYLPQYQANRKES